MLTDKRSVLLFLGTGHGDPNLRRFSSGIVLRTREDAHRYLVDSGDGMQTKLIRRGVSPETLEGIFITHMHDDHVGGLATVIKAASKYRKRNPEGHLHVYLPEEAGAQALMGWLDAMRIPFRERNCHIHSYGPGQFYDDGILSVTAWPTEHNRPGLSNAFLLQFEGRRVVVTGDLSSNFHDFPLAQIAALPEPADIVVCELTHYRIEFADAIMGGLNTKRLIYTHVHDPWDRPEGRRIFQEYADKLPYPVEIAEDNCIYPIEQ